MILDIKVFIHDIRGLLDKVSYQKLTYSTHSILILGMVLNNYRINTLPYGEKHQKILQNLKVSNHILLIERGRYCSPKLPREEHLCSTCSKCRLEDEQHFLLDCPFYNEERNSLKLWLLVVKNMDFNKLDFDPKIRNTK